MLVRRAVVIAALTALTAGRLASRLLVNRVRRREARATIVAAAFAELAERLGPAFIKLAQILSTRADLLSPAVTRVLARLQDDVEPISAAEAELLLRDALGLRFDGVLASGSIASVVRCRLRDGRPVAVKIRRPDAAATVAVDVRLWRAGARVVARIPRLAHLPVVASVGDLTAAIEDQCDLRLEARRYRRLRTALADVPGVVVPDVLDELTSEDVLTMELIERPSAESAPPLDSVLASVRALYKLIFVEGLVHCDLHPGNLWLRGDGTAVVLDCGFMRELERADRIRFADFFLALASGDGPRCAEIVLETAVSVPAALDRDAFESDIAELVARMSRAAVEDFQVGAFVLSLFEVQRRHGVRGTSAFAMTIVALLVLEGTVKSHAPQLDFQAEAVPYVTSALAGSAVPVTTPQ